MLQENISTLIETGNFVTNVIPVGCVHLLRIQMGWNFYFYCVWKR